MEETLARGARLDVVTLGPCHAVVLTALHLDDFHILAPGLFDERQQVLSMLNDGLWESEREEKNWQLHMISRFGWRHAWAKCTAEI